MRTMLRSGAIVLALFAGASYAVAADDAQSGKINRGAGELQSPPVGAPPGAMQQSGPGEDVNNLSSKTPNAHPGGENAGRDAAAAPPMMNPPTTGVAPVAPGGAGAPIGATPQTTPSKFSTDNDAKDKAPIMAMPLALDDAQKQHIYRSIMANPQGQTLAIDVKPAQQLPSNVVLYDLPADVTEQIPAVRDYKYVRLDNKILLVSPPNRTVVGEITR